MADQLRELAPEDCSSLVKHLSKFAYKWKSLGTALNFRSEDLENIEICLPLIPGSPFSYMQRLVEEWLERTHPYTAPPTLASLLEALNSHAVGLGTLGTELSTLPLQNLQKEATGAKIVEFASLSEDNAIVFNRSEDIIIDEGMSVRLKVKTSSDKQKCWWKNTGLVPVADEKKYMGIHEPTLNVLSADVDMDGSRYFCEIEYGRHIRTTTGVTLRVLCPQLDSLKANLASTYLAQPEVPEDSWPPVSNKAFINLALIKQQDINYNGEYARITIRGDMDDILLHKERIKYENIFHWLRSGSLLLIEGRPGSGKTTFVNKITRDWAADKVQGPMRLLLLVSLRVLNDWTRPVTLEDILRLLKVQLAPEMLEERNGKGVCFIFDGLDEFSPFNGNKSIIYEIIKGHYLPKSIVIVASRPAALVKLRQRANIVIEVIGFLRDQIFEYFENYPFSNRLKVEELRSYISTHPNILHMCYLPIHAAMVAFLFKMIGTVPRTETEMYRHFTRFTLMRSLSKHNEEELENVDIDKLSGEESELFGTICEIALKQTVLNKQVLDQNLGLQSKGSKDISLGLITVDRTAGLYGYKNIYTFLHLTYQEYLAAYHISTLSDEDQLKLIRQHRDKDHMQVVWKFYCGLVKFEGQEHKIKTLLVKRKNVALFDIHCAHESQQEVVCECIVKEGNAQIILEDKFLIMSDFTALGYLLANSSKSVSLSLINCNINDEAVDNLLKETDHKPLNIAEFSLTSTRVGIKALFNVLQILEELKCLALNHSCIDIENQHDDVSGTLSDFSALKQLVLRDVLIGHLATPLASKLSHSVMLQPVDLSNNTYVSVEGIKTLLTSLTGCSNLQRLVLNGTSLLSDCAHVLASCFQHWPKLQELHLNECVMGEEEGEAIADSLRHCTKLIKLEIDGNDISHRTLQKIYSNLHTHTCCTLF